MIKNTRTLTVMAALAAMSVVLVCLIHFPIFPSAPFLEYDPADIPILICAFAFGPVPSLIVTVIASAIQAMTVSAGSGIYGFIMHVIATTALTLPAACIYQQNKTRSGALSGMLIGLFIMAGSMLLANHFITPHFMGTTTEVVDSLLLPIILPFNLIKGGVNCLVTFLIYKPLSRFVIKGK